MGVCNGSCEACDCGIAGIAIVKKRFTFVAVSELGLVGLTNEGKDI